MKTMEMEKEGKVLHAYYSKTIKKLVQFAVDYLIPREDVVSILTIGDLGDREYVMLYYYG